MGNVWSVKCDSKESKITLIALPHPLQQKSPSFSEDDSLFEEEEEDFKIPLLKVSLFCTKICS